MIRRGLGAVSWIKSEERLNAVGDEIISHSYCGEPAKSQENSEPAVLSRLHRLNSDFEGDIKIFEIRTGHVEVPSSFH